MIENYEVIVKEINGGKHLIIPGIDWGYANPSYLGLLIIKETEHYYLCRKKGGGCWVSLGAQGYDSSEYIIFKKIKGGVEKPLGDWSLEYTRETMKEAKAKALQELESREKHVSI